MLTASSLIRPVGHTGMLRCGRLDIAVRIVDCRTTYDHLDVLVEPLSGTGQQWVEAEAVSLTQSEGYDKVAVPHD